MRRPGHLASEMPIWLAVLAAVVAGVAASRWIDLAHATLIFEDSSLYGVYPRMLEGVIVVCASSLAVLALIRYAIVRQLPWLGVAAALGLVAFAIGCITLSRIAGVPALECTPENATDPSCRGTLILFSGEALDADYWQQWAVLLGGLTTTVFSGLRLYFHIVESQASATTS